MTPPPMELYLVALHSGSCPASKFALEKLAPNMDMSSRNQFSSQTFNRPSLMRSVQCTKACFRRPKAQQSIGEASGDFTGIGKKWYRYQPLLSFFERRRLSNEMYGLALMELDPICIPTIQTWYVMTIVSERQPDNNCNSPWHFWRTSHCNRNQQLP